ncbi:hypothetical protein HK102_000702 [Quaeritorhiza haematococci]|nr:hypothetical protein HK102_000702 [Quaeritorhiza haematococci]
MLQGTDMKVQEYRRNQDGSVTYLTRYGIRIVFAQAGEVGTFDMMQLLVNLVAAVALLRVATLIVDALMFYVMKHKAIYTKAKFEKVEGFSVLKEQERTRAADKSDRSPRPSATFATSFTTAMGTTYANISTSLDPNTSVGIHGGRSRSPSPAVAGSGLGIPEYEERGRQSASVEFERSTSSSQPILVMPGFENAPAARGY